MVLMIILFAYLMIYLLAAGIGAGWVAFNAALIHNFGAFGICLVATIHILGPVLLLAILVG